MISKSTFFALTFIFLTIAGLIANQYYMREAMYAEDLAIPNDFVCIKNKWDDHLIICSKEEPYYLWGITPRVGKLAKEGDL